MRAVIVIVAAHRRALGHFNHQRRPGWCVCAGPRTRRLSAEMSRDMRRGLVYACFMRVAAFVTGGWIESPATTGPAAPRTSGSGGAHDHPYPKPFRVGMGSAQGLNFGNRVGQA